MWPCEAFLCYGLFSWVQCLPSILRKEEKHPGSLVLLIIYVKYVSTEGESAAFTAVRFTLTWILMTVAVVSAQLSHEWRWWLVFSSLTAETLAFCLFLGSIFLFIDGVQCQCNLKMTKGWATCDFHTLPLPPPLFASASFFPLIHPTL